MSDKKEIINEIIHYWEVGGYGISSQFGMLSTSEIVDYYTAHLNSSVLKKVIDKVDITQPYWWSWNKLGFNNGSEFEDWKRDITIEVIQKVLRNKDKEYADLLDIIIRQGCVIKWSKFTSMVSRYLKEWDSDYWFFDLKSECDETVDISNGEDVVLDSVIDFLDTHRDFVVVKDKVAGTEVLICRRNGNFFTVSGNWKIVIDGEGADES